MQSMQEVIKDIQDNRTQISASVADEERVMRAMLNDPSYKVGVYDRNGVVEEYCPHDDAREMLTSIISGAAKIDRSEAKQLADEYKFKKSESESMIRIGKEFTNTYLKTGRKLPFGKREKHDVSLSIRRIEEGTERTYPTKVGVNEDGTSRYGNGTISMPEHESWRVHGGCPEHLRK